MYLPVVYTIARYAMILRRAISITRAIGRGGPWNGNERSEFHLRPKSWHLTGSALLYGEEPFGLSLSRWLRKKFSNHFYNEFFFYLCRGVKSRWWSITSPCWRPKMFTLTPFLFPTWACRVRIKPLQTCCGSWSGAFLTPGPGSGIGFFRIPDPKPIFLRG